jgi:hypothetical protein
MSDRPTVDARLRTAFLAVTEKRLRRDHAPGLIQDGLRPMAQGYPGDLPRTWVPLRTVTHLTSPTDNYCPRCDCLTSGWADQANNRSEWCTDNDCTCHDELPGDKEV